MPYISPDRRDYYLPQIDILADKIRSVAGNEEIDGDLNFIISTLVSRALLTGKDGTKRKKYHFLERVVGIFECAKLEFYRRVMGPKEDMAIVKNKDLPEYEEALDPDPSGPNKVEYHV